MTLHEIEGWALSVIERVKTGQPYEDSRVELKAEWPKEFEKAARRLAGHANAAKGMPILWLIGVDGQAGVVGAAHEEMSRWYAQIQSRFDERAPSVSDVNVSVEGKVVVALVFVTDRAPYVIKASQPGSVTHEIPWREGTAVRSAKRADMLRLMFALNQGNELRVRYEGYLNRWENEWNGQRRIDCHDWKKAQDILQTAYDKLLDLDSDYRRLLSPERARHMEQILVDLQDAVRDVRAGGAFGDEMPFDAWEKVGKLISEIRRLVINS